jgi:hypothetical protein
VSKHKWHGKHGWRNGEGALTTVTRVRFWAWRHM